MSTIQTTGTCLACRERFSGQAIARHLGSCPKRPGGTFPAFDLRAQAGPYWLYLQASAKATLKDLDALLRETWVECCGHLSAFDIGGKRYQADMGVPLERVLRPGLKFGYEYDFGSTTELDLQVLGERQGARGGRAITILARNDPPEIPCEECKREGAHAKNICTECQIAICGPCGKKHDCDEDMRLPLVNSPRAGVCGYTG
jgi:hypothetical protein